MPISAIAEPNHIPPSPFWESQSVEPLPLPLAVPALDGFFGAPPTLSARFKRLVLPEHPLLEIRYAFSRRLKTSVPGFPVRRLTVHVLNRRTKELVGYIRAIKVGPGLSDNDFMNLGQVGGGISADFGSAMATMQSTHLNPSEMLKEGLFTHALVYIEMFEVAAKHRGQGVGTAAVSAVLCNLEASENIGLFMYRPYPCQYLRTEVHDCVFSHDTEAVTAYAQFCKDTAAVSRHYAKEWAAHRLPGSEYFVASIGAAFSFGFNEPLCQWALLPNY